MRLKSLFAIALAILSLGMVAAPQSASATHWDRPDQAAGWGRLRTVRHWVYYPRYHHTYVKHERTDPYAYRYTPRGYYPYYNSAYWGRPHVKRFRGFLPHYYEAWGGPQRGYRHVEWHQQHYGGHRRGNW
jgi:hypothetical protein